MEIVPIHYKKSELVKKYSQIEQEAHEMAAMIDAKDFKGVHRAAFALAHAQVSTEPLAFFVLDKQLVKGLGEDEQMAVYEDRVIMNPEILEAPVYYTDKKLLQALRNHEEMKGEELVPGKMPNSRQYVEGCMSFPHRRGKRVNRYNKIKVRYQIKGAFGLKKVTKWLEGLPSQVFQHEFDHTQGQNIFFDGHKD